MDDSDLLFDVDLDLAMNDNKEQSNGTKENPEEIDDEDFDAIDLEELVEATASVEQRHANGNISFVSDAQDPPPPPALPENTPCFHPFDPEQLRTWIYPINYPIRAYQLNIVQKAMFHNTLVALPTGLGKTFIAAVVMFNYYRWFPQSKVIFMAPTRPLVTQQIEACFSICGIPQDDTTDMMGNTSPAKRRELWKSKRVFFATPQTIQKDIETNSCPAEKVSCIVVDEAHRATGNFAYSEVVRKLFKKNKDFRILALTATPGSNLDAVQDIVDNLHITNIQIRTEESMDIREYSFGKRVERRIVRLDYTEGTTGILPRVISDYRARVLLPLLEELSKKPTSVVPSIDRASPYGLRAARLGFQATCKNLNNSLKFSVVSLFLVAESASRAHELLCMHGIVPFLESIEATFQEYKTKIDEGGKLTKAQAAFYNHTVLNALVREMKREVERPMFVGHPKLEQLTSILLSHFTETQEQSKVMIFSSFRSSVMDICQVLNRHQPIIRCSHFIGQASDKSGTKGLKQSEQQDVIQKFKNNEYNVLVSTSIGEEGLDIGEVDLIICFDSQTSPIRMLQRMGRTGRKRQGRCILLLTESEEKKFSQAKETYERIQRLIAKGGLIRYYQANPHILPRNYRPTICKKRIDVGVYQPKALPKKRKRGADISNHSGDGFLKPEMELSFLRSFNGTFHNLDQVRERYWPTSPTAHAVNKYMPLQTRLQTAFRSGHSRRTLQFVRLVQKMEHQIMHPNESFQAPKPTATRLILPSKAKTKPKPESDLDAFLENSDMSRILGDSHADNINTSEGEPSGHDKKGKGKANSELDKRESTLTKEVDRKGKGKSKMTSEPDLDFDSNFALSRTPSWEPMLSDHLFEDNRSPQSPVASFPSMDLDLSFIEPSAQKPTESMSEDEFDEFPLDELFMEHPNILMPVQDPFNDPLEPIFPFEKKIPDQGKITFVWAQKVPQLGDKAMRELEKRQEEFKRVHGRYMAMHFVQKYNSLSPNVKSTIPKITEVVESFSNTPKSPSIEVNLPITERTEDIQPTLSTSRSPSLKVNSPITERMEAVQTTLSTSRSPSLQTNSPITEFLEEEPHANVKKEAANEENEEECEFELDFNDSMFANFLENKYSQDEGQDFPSFLFEQEPESSQHILKKASLYKVDEDEEEPMIMIDLNEPFSDDSADEQELPKSSESTKEIVQMSPQLIDDSSDDDKAKEQVETSKNNSVEAETASNKKDGFEEEPLNNSNYKKDENEAIVLEKHSDIDNEDKITPSTSHTNRETKGESRSYNVIIDSSDEDEPFNNHDNTKPKSKDSSRASSLNVTPNIDQRNAISPFSDESPLIHRRPRKRNRIVSEDEQDSPVSLMSLSKGHYSPSPFRATSVDSETSPFAIRRPRKLKNRVLSIDEEEDEDSISLLNTEPTRKRLKQMSDPLNEDDFDTTTSHNRFLQRLQESGYGAHHNRGFLDHRQENPFIDDEAEKSEDGGHTEEEDISEGSSLMNSFIDDNSSVGPSSRISNDGNHRNVYARGLMDTQPFNNRHWLSKFNADKWLKINEEDDREVVTEEEEELESIQDFSSAFDNPAVNLVDDDDFM